MPAISVKVSTKKVVAAMEAKIAEHQKKIAEYEKAEAKWEAEKTKHQQFVREKADKIARSAGVTPVICVSDARQWGEHAGKVQVEVTYFLTKEDAAALLPPKFEHRACEVSAWKDQVQELGNAVRLLKMTDEEYVNTSTYKSVAKYL